MGIEGVDYGRDPARWRSNRASIPSTASADATFLVTSTSVLAAASLTNSALITPAQAQSNAPVPTPTFSSEALTQRTAERRAVEAAI